MSKIQTKRQELAAKALQLKKSAILLHALFGKKNYDGIGSFEIENYNKFPKEVLRVHVQDFERDLRKTTLAAFPDMDRTRFSKASVWLEKKFDEWFAAGCGNFELGRVHEVEAVLGRLIHREVMDCPPYAQVLIQGFFGSAIRHPEYHLAKDLALLNNLFLDAQNSIDDLWKQGIVHSDEHVQSLGRSVILSCFNLLEAFVSGLSTAHLIEHPNIREEHRTVLQDERAPLRTRFFKFPNIMSVNPNLIDPNKQPFKDLFGVCKEQRDSFVHCEPGPKPSKGGVVKEERFHDITANGVRKTVDLTCDAICLVWKKLYDRDRPTWLPTPDSEGRFPHVTAELCWINGEDSMDDIKDRL